MENRKNQGAGRSTPPAKRNGNGKGKGASLRRAAKDAVLARNKQLIERVRQVISETPEVRPEKVGPLQEAVDQGTYTADVRKLANILIAKLFLDP